MKPVTEQVFQTSRTFKDLSFQFRYALRTRLTFHSLFVFNDVIDNHDLNENNKIIAKAEKSPGNEVVYKSRIPRG